MGFNSGFKGLTLQRTWHIGERTLLHSFSGADDESLDVPSHLGWENATASYHETETVMDR